MTDPRPLALLIVNRRARRVERASRAGWLSVLGERLSSRYVVTSHFPAGATEGEAIARDAAATGTALVIAVGGDGTVHAIANGLAGSATALGIVPYGAANDLARELGIPRDAESVAARLLEGRARWVDLGDVQGRGFLTVAGLGLVSSSALAVNAAKGGGTVARRAVDMVGGSSYRLAAIAQILGRRRITNALRLRWHDSDVQHERTMDLDVHAVFITNHRTCGGGLEIPSGGRGDDGVIEVCMVPATSRARLLANLHRLSAGHAIPEDVLTIVRCEGAVIELGEVDAMIADGELVARGRRFEIGVRPRAVQIVS
jgi:diacylglycerol kinase (ATP)